MDAPRSTTWPARPRVARRISVAALIGADPSNIALIPSVSGAAGLVAAQLGPVGPGHNVVIGEHEYSSNHYPWRLLAGKGYEVRQVPFRNGGIEPDEVAAHVDGTALVALSGVQTATGHRSEIRTISTIAREVGAIVFVDGSQLVGALPVAGDLDAIDVLATADHKFLGHPGRGLGYCYLSPAMQDRFVPVNAGWKAARVPLESCFGPEMVLSPTASRFDNSISWIAAVGSVAALSVFGELGAEAIFARNRELAALLRASLAEAGWPPVDLPETNRSTIVAVPLGDADPRGSSATSNGVASCAQPRRQPAVRGPLLQPRRRHRPAHEHAARSSEPSRARIPPRKVSATVRHGGARARWQA